MIALAADPIVRGPEASISQAANSEKCAGYGSTLLRAAPAMQLSIPFQFAGLAFAR